MTDLETILKEFNEKFVDYQFGFSTEMWVVVKSFIIQVYQTAYESGRKKGYNEGTSAVEPDEIKIRHKPLN